MNETREIRDGCNQRFKNLEEKTKEIPSMKSLIEKNNLLVEIMIEDNKKRDKIDRDLTNAIDNMNITMAEIKENMSNLNKGYDELKKGQDDMKVEFNSKVDGLEEEIQKDREKNMIDMRDWLKKHWGKIMVVVLLGYEVIVRLIV